MIEVDKTYETKFATKEKFTVKRINYDKNGIPRTVFGIFEKSPNLGECPLSAERLIDPEKTEITNINKVCKYCNRPLPEEFITN